LIIVRQFFEANEVWLTHLLQRGRARKSPTFPGSPVENARYRVSTLEGAMLLSRSCGDASRFRSAAARILGDFGVGKQRVAAKRARP
jgi:hypothetical protein